MSRPRQFKLPIGEIVVFTRGAPEDGRINQDGAAVMDISDTKTLVLAVADGVGSYANAHEASKLTLSKVLQSIKKSRREDRQVRDGIIDGFEKANLALQEKFNGTATTLTVVLIAGDELRCFHAGDSEAYVIGQRGKVKMQTINHSPVGYAVEAGVVDEEDAIYHEERHLVSNVVGSSTMRIELGARHKLAQRDTLVLGTDGLFDNLTLDEIVERVRKGPLLDASNRLVDEASDRMVNGKSPEPSKPDDMTFVLFRR